MTNNPNRAMTEQYQQAPTEPSRKTRASIATLGLAISMGATGLLLPRQGDRAIAAEPVPAPSIESSSTTTPGYTYTVQPNDTLVQVARAHEVALEALAAANHLTVDASLAPGQQLVIPARSNPQSAVGIVGTVPAATNESLTATTVAERATPTAEDKAERPATIALNTTQIPALPDVAREAGEQLSATAVELPGPSAQPPAPAAPPAAAGEAAPDVFVTSISSAQAPVLDRLQAPQERLSQALGSLSGSASQQLRSTNEAIGLLALESAPAASSEVVAPASIALRAAQAPADLAEPVETTEAADSDTASSNDLVVVSLPMGGDRHLTAVAVSAQPLDRPAVPMSATKAIPAAEAGGGAANPLPSIAAPQPIAGVATSDVPTASSRFQPATANSDLASPRYSPYIDGLRAEIQALQSRYQGQGASESARSGAISLLSPAASTAVAASRLPVAANQAAPNPKPTELTPLPGALNAEDPRRTQLMAAASEPLSGRDPRVQTLLNSSVAPQLPPLADPSNYLPGGRPSQSRGYIWPTQGVLTSGYGWRWGRMHRGIDIAAPIGTPIVAAADGVVVSAGWNSGGYGNLVDIRHPDGSLTRYAHNNRLLVRAGQEVRQGQLISEMGTTGRSTGPHLHFEVRPTGQGAVNPMAFMPRGGLRAAR